MNRPVTTLEHALLGLIEQAPISGYDLCKVFETTPMGHYSASPGSIYPALKRLEARGLIEGQVEKATTLRPRRMFELTVDGREELVRWVSQPVTRRDIVWAEDDVLLRFGFMDALVGRDDVVRFLDEVVLQCSAELDSLEKHHRGMRAAESADDAPPTGRLALGYGIASYRTLRRWAKQARDELRRFDD